MERRSGFYVGYSPERVNPGDPNRTLSQIVKITSGSSPKIAQQIDSLYAKIIDAGTHLCPNIRTAEMAKVIENAQRDVNIGFVNEIAVICNLLGLNVHEVLDAAETKWNFLPFRPGLVGGHCIGVDPYYLAHKASQHNYLADIILAGRKVNEKMVTHLCELILKRLAKINKPFDKIKIGILGVTFKRDCCDIRNSKIFELMAELTEWGCQCVAFDPIANNLDVQQEFQIELVDMKDLKNLDCVVIAVPHKSIRNLRSIDIEKMLVVDGEVFVFDIYRSLNWGKANSSLEVITI